MGAHGIAREHQQMAGWTDETLLDVLLDYVDNQQDSDTLDDYLTERRDNEDDPAIAELARLRKTYDERRRVTPDRLHQNSLGIEVFRAAERIRDTTQDPEVANVAASLVDYVRNVMFGKED